MKKLGTTILLSSVLLTPWIAVADIAPSQTEVCPILNGSHIPEASVVDLDGNTVDLKARVSEQATLLIFYRGGW